MSDLGNFLRKFNECFSQGTRFILRAKKFNLVHTTFLRLLFKGNRKSIVLAVFLLLASQASLSESHRWWSLDYLAQSFAEIALKTEYGVKEKTISKWVGPIAFYYDHQVEDQKLHEYLTGLHLRHLTAITGIAFVPVDKKEKADLIILFTQEKFIRSTLQQYMGRNSMQLVNHLTRNSVCVAHIKTTKGGAIKAARVLIPVDRARSHAKLLSCIVEELTQIMGLLNDADTVYPSIFNDKTYNELLTGLDYILLRVLYDDRVKVGMKADEVMPVVHTIIKEYQHRGVIHNAVDEVTKGQLYSVLED